MSSVAGTDNPQKYEKKRTNQYKYAFKQFIHINIFIT